MEIKYDIFDYEGAYNNPLFLNGKYSDIDYVHFEKLDIKIGTFVLSDRSKDYISINISLFADYLFQLNGYTIDKIVIVTGKSVDSYYNIGILVTSFSSMDSIKNVSIKVDCSYYTIFEAYQYIIDNIFEFVNLMK